MMSITCAGNYIIAMALMSQLPSPGCVGLQDHVPATLDSGDMLIKNHFLGIHYFG